MDCLAAAARAELAVSVDLIAWCSVRRLARAIPAPAILPFRNAFIASTPCRRGVWACTAWCWNVGSRLSALLEPLAAPRMSPGRNPVTIGGN